MDDLWPWYVEVDRLRKLMARKFPGFTTSVSVSVQRGGLVDVTAYVHRGPLVGVSERVYVCGEAAPSEDDALVMAARACALRIEAEQWDMDGETRPVAGEGHDVV